MAHKNTPNKSGKHNHHAKQVTALGNGKDRTNLKKAFRDGNTEAIDELIQKENNADRKLRHTKKMR